LGRDLRTRLDDNATLSDNHFVEYHEVYGTAPGDTVRYDGNALGFVPASLANLTARLSWGGASVAGTARYAGRIFLDNHQDILSSAGPRTVLDVAAGWRAPAGPGSGLEVTLRVLNALDTRYATGGYMDYDATGALVPQFMPAATRHWIAEVRSTF
jgi:hypothetical protein